MSDILWQNRVRLMQLKAEVRALANEVAQADQAARRAKLTRLTGDCRTVLRALVEGSDDHAYPFRALARITGLNRSACRRACRALARLGFARLHLGLWTEDGDMVGAGYGVTRVGVTWWHQSEGVEP